MLNLQSDARRLAAAMLTGPFTEPELFARAAPLVSGRAIWLHRMIVGIVERFAPTRPRLRTLARFIRTHRSFVRAAKHREMPIEQSFQTAEFVPGLIRSLPPDVPRWNTVGELAAWLRLSQRELNWFADRRHLQRLTAEGPLRHYRYRWMRKRRRGSRLIESPKSRLREVQRRLLRGLFENIPLHEAAHGFCRGRSVRSHAEPHVGRAVVLRLDLQDFFASVHPGRMTRLLMAFGYAEEVAEFLTSLCTHWTPSDVWQHWPDPEDHRGRYSTAKLYCRPHLPQGVPTSPAIANLCAWRLDCRLTGLAHWAGAKYTRYADDLLFSGDQKFVHRIDWFRICAAAIAIEEGFAVNHRKTLVMRSSARQHAVGLVLNQKLQTGRDEFDRLKAILHHAVRQGPASQNLHAHPDFRAHLLGRIQYVGQWNPQRAEKLQRLFSTIQWD